MLLLGMVLLSMLLLLLLLLLSGHGSLLMLESPIGQGIRMLLKGRVLQRRVVAVRT